jgi:hypothetical protein
VATALVVALVGATTGGRAVATEPGSPAITVRADAPSVYADASIGFTVSGRNGGVAGPGGNELVGNLPAGADVRWRIDPAYGGPGRCAVRGSAPAQQLHCDAHTPFSVHVVSSTTVASCGRYALAVGAASAATDVLCLGIAATTAPPRTATVLPSVLPPVLPSVPPTGSSAAPHVTESLASTAGGSFGTELAVAAVLVVLGALMVAAGLWRGSGRDRR